MQFDISFGELEKLFGFLSRGKISRKAFELFLREPDRLLRARAFTFEEHLAACQQERLNIDFKAEAWPLEPVAFDESTWGVSTVRISEGINGYNAISQVNSMGDGINIKPIGPRRSMEFIAANPKAQLSDPIVIPIIGIDSSGYEVLPIFDVPYSGESKKSLFLQKAEKVLPAGSLLLVLKKINQNPSY
jgi:hypothetical protein